jgi:membrane protease YdiL (CAAX protease family)
MLFGCFFMMTMLALFVSAIVIAATMWREVRLYRRFGLTLALIVFVSGVVTTFMNPAALVAAPVPLLVCTLAVGFLPMFLYTIVGMNLCRRLGWADAPLLRRMIRPRRPRPLVPRGGVSAGLLVGAAAVAHTITLFSLAKPRMSETMHQLFGDGSDANTDILTAVQLVLFVVQIALAEEITFRLGVLSMLAYMFRNQRAGTWIAIALTSVIWTIGHASTLEPEWVKFAQILPAGIALGWLQRRYGLETAFLAHAVLNVSAYGLSSLIEY